MKKTLLFLFAVVLIGAQFAYTDDGRNIFSSASQKVEKNLWKGIFYDMTITDKTGKTVQKGVAYNKNNKVRMDFGDLITIVNGDDMYLYNVANKSAMKMSAHKETGQNKLESFDSFKVPDNSVFIKKTTKNGYACSLVKAEEDGIKMDYYLTEEFGFPTCVKTSDGNEINMTNFKIGVTDDKFKLPAGVKITDMNNFMGASSESSKQEKTNALSAMMKEVADDTVVSGAKEGKDEVVSEQKNKVKEETKSKTKEAVNKLFGF
ncbi:MAG: hypothetical protein PHR82_04975 [Endomicrobiaceae bacterium]|nr:hypothetical protein [Endomicrobiaceae bacterium]